MRAVHTPGLFPVALLYSLFTMNISQRFPLRLVAPALALMLASPGLLALSFDQTPSGKYKLEKTHAYINFSYSHMGFSWPVLRFDDFEVDMDFDSSNIEKSSFVVTVQAASVNSGVEKFDQHLREKKHFFETAEHPEIVFRSKEISQYADNRLEVKGSLVIKGKSRPLTLQVTLNGAGLNPLSSNPTIGASATGALVRSDWGLDYATPMVSDEVDLRIEVELIAVSDNAGPPNAKGTEKAEEASE